jgi:hypothetical protein
MSAANVQFMDIYGKPCPQDQKPARFSFPCAREVRDTCASLLIAEGPHSAAHGVKRNGQNQNGGRAQWDWDGNRAAPTFSPSINCESACGWHGYIRNGRCVNSSGQDEPPHTTEGERHG